jgi:predicted Kef-type K+ transport protein
MDILLASLVLVITSKTIVVAVVVKAFGYSSKNSFLVSILLYVIGLTWYYLNTWRVFLRNM